MIFDAHFHIIDYQYPLVNNEDYKPDEFKLEDYLARVNSLDIQGGAIVSASFQAYDQTYLLAALKKLGRNFVGVTQLPLDTPEEDIIELNKNKIRAVRFNFYRGVTKPNDGIVKFAEKIYNLVNWHVELYLDAKDIRTYKNLILSFPAVSIDHLGLSKAGFDDLLWLIEKGVKVKATGFSRVNFDIVDALKNIYAINTNALMFGTDLPGTRAPRPFSNEDFFLIKESFDNAALEKICWSNAYHFYLKPKPVQSRQS